MQQTTHHYCWYSEMYLSWMLQAEQLEVSRCSAMREWCEASFHTENYCSDLEQSDLLVE